MCIRDRVTSVTEGDMSVHFQYDTEEFQRGFLYDYREQLNQFRKTGW